MERVASAGRVKLIKKTTWKRNEGVVGQVWATGAPLLIDDYRGWSGRVKSGDSLPSRAVLGVPIRCGEGAVWSAYLAPDLAPVFAETPWLDIRPGSEGQAELLSRLASIRAAEVRAALPVAVPSSAGLAASGPFTDPRQFLLQVMNDERVEMGWRIEAAKALLSPSATSACGC